MPRYRFDLPTNKPQAVVDKVVAAANALGAVLAAMPSFRILAFDSYQYQIVVDKLSSEDAAFLVLTHNLTVVRKE